MTTLMLSLLATPDAAACGGFACSQARPILQNAERIVFGLDDDRNWVEMHVQITFEGQAEDFAWIVPVPKDPELMVSSSGLFQRLARATQPVFNLRQIDEGHCSDGVDANFFGMAEYGIAMASDRGASTTGGTVNVVAQQAVGPYDTVTLQAETTDGLLAWLDENGYDVPDTIDAALAPYVARDAYFVALKLQKDKDTGDLAPLALRYDASKAMVPVQLTSISATPDMRMEAYVLAQARAVPESYLHVRINDAAVDWFTGGPNYTDVITQAADEAGGHAFATDYYGPSDIAAPIWDEAALDEQRLRDAGSPQAWIEALRGPVRIGTTELYELFEDELGVVEGSGQVAWQCSDCVSYSAAFNAKTATDAFLERVADPMGTAQRLLDRYAFVTRMTSSLDAVEMNVDPVFVLNRDMTAQVSKRRNADLVYKCGNGRVRMDAPMELVLADGRTIELPSQNWFSSHDTTPFEYIQELGETKAQVIEQTGAEGQPLVLVDHTPAFFEAVRLHNKLMAGCNAGGGLGAGLGVAGFGALALVIRRRRS